MRYIGLSDIDNVPIFEGDTLEITNRDDMEFDEKFLDFLNIDKITIQVNELNKEVGVDLDYYFWSNGSRISNADESKYHKYNGFSSDQLNQHYEGLEMISPASYKCQSWHNSLFFHHGFMHRKSKKIINSKFPLENREFHLNDVHISELIVTIGDKSYNALDTCFKVKLNNETLDYVKEVHDHLYGDTAKEGEFSHILIKPKKVSRTDYELRCEPINENGEHSWVDVSYDRVKYLELARPIKQRWRDLISKWELDNVDLDSEIVRLKKLDMWKQAEAEFLPLEKSKLTEVKEPCKSLFLGLCMSKNLFEFFTDRECEIVAIVSNQSV